MVSRSAIALFVAVCGFGGLGCGNLSNDDVAFIEAIPQKEQLQLKVPSNGTSQPACSLGSADIYTSARTTGDNINAGVSGLLTLVDAIRGVPATTRDTDSRTWGPFPDGNHPGFNVEVDMQREVDDQGVPWRWDYQISEGPSGASMSTIVEGNFYGAQARTGNGHIVLHFETSQKLGIAAATDPQFPMSIYYDLGGDPHTVSLDLTEGTGFGVPSFDYEYSGFADGHGSFAYAVAGGNGCTEEVNTQFDAVGAGRDNFHVRCGPFLSQEVQQCWDASACLSFVDDPLGITPICLGQKPCSMGSALSCPSL
jgi:hypothetical protein